LGVAVAILLAVDRRLNPAPFSGITTVPPAAVWPHTVATVSVIETRKKSTLVEDNGVKRLTLPRVGTLETNEHQRIRKRHGR